MTTMVRILGKKNHLFSFPQPAGEKVENISFFSHKKEANAAPLRTFQKSKRIFLKLSSFFLTSRLGETRGKEEEKKFAF